MRAGQSILFGHARIIDGTGGPAYDGDVLVERGRIVQIARAGGIRVRKGQVTLDLGGLVLSPGFIDAHAHDDFILPFDRDIKWKAMQGVTTSIVGNCGCGATPFDGHVDSLAGTDLDTEIKAAQYPWPRLRDCLAELKTNPPGINFGFHVPHRLVRATVMGAREEPAGRSQIASMKRIVRQAMEDGALGLSTGLYYTPGKLVPRDAMKRELVALLKEVARFRCIYAAHIRDEGAGLPASVEESLATARAAGVALLISHFKANGGRRAWPLIDDAMRLIEEARRNGQRVAADQYPYTASSTTLRAYIRSGIARRQPANIRICSSGTHPGMVGQTLVAAAREMKMSPARAAEALLPATVMYFGQSEKVVRLVMRQPWVMVGSDGIPGSPHPHPRLFGTFPRVLGQYSRDQGLLSLEEAVRKMTGLPAATFGLKDRGLVRVGAVADLVVFDPDKVIDAATYDHPKRYPRGVLHVMVNGEFIVRDARFTARVPAGRRPGRGLTKRE